MAKVIIEDNGSGMNSGTINNLFQPFFTSKEPGKGTGLGMYIVQRIIKKYEGHIEVKSQIGSGTILKLTIPLATEAVLLK